MANDEITFRLVTYAYDGPKILGERTDYQKPTVLDENGTVWYTHKKFTAHLDVNAFGKVIPVAQTITLTFYIDGFTYS